MMIKCQKCGFENQMGSIFCRECGEKLNMDAIDPNKLQKDVDKEKLIKKTKKRIKSLISTCIGLLILAAFLGVIFYNGGLREYEEPSVNSASVSQKYTNSVRGTTNGQVTYSYPEVNEIIKSKIVQPLSEMDSFVKITAAEVTWDEEKAQPVIYIWASIKDKVPVIYTIHGDVNLIKVGEDEEDPPVPIEVDVSRLDIGRLPIFYRSDIFLNGFESLINNDVVVDFFRRAKSAKFDENGLTANLSNKPVSSNSPAPSAASAKNDAKSEAARQAAEEKKRKAEEAKQKAEEAKQRAAEEKQRKAEEAKQKAEEAKQRAEEAKREREEKQRQLEEERRERQEEARREREERQRERERERNNNSWGNSRNSRNRNSSRNRY